MTTQMKALDEYFLMVLFTLLLNRVHVFTIFMFEFGQKGENLSISVSILNRQTSLTFSFRKTKIVNKLSSRTSWIYDS